MFAESVSLGTCSFSSLAAPFQEWNRDGRYRDVEDVLRSAAYDRDSVELIGRALAKIIGGTSVSQAVKGIFSAGALKTVKYSAAKLRKMYKSLK